MNFRYKRIAKGLSARILNDFIMGASNRQIARSVHVTEHCVRGRLERMAQQGMLRHREYLSRITGINEAICYDGLENFARSQYEPNYINQAVGSDSLFVYDFNYSPLNRKGYMSDRQKLKNERMQKELGIFSRNAHQHATRVLLERLCGLRSRKARPDGQSPIVLFTDQHYAYPRAIRSLPAGSFHHKTVSSKAVRNYKNILFPVNHLDLMIRHEVGAFSRETISFSKSHGRMCQKYALFMIHRNYLRTQFTKKQKRRPLAHQQSPAQFLGLERRVLKFHEFFAELHTPTQVPLPDDWTLFHQAQVPYPRIKNKLN